MTNENIYDDSIYVKRNKYASIILFCKCISTLPFNIVAIIYPEMVQDYPWLLFMEAFYHYHTRIFYLLALHRNLMQAYCALVSNGDIQKKLLLLETLFDIGLVTLYVHEYYSLHNFKAFVSPHSLIHTAIAIFSSHSLLLSHYYTKRNLA